MMRHLKTDSAKLLIAVVGLILLVMGIGITLSFVPRWLEGSPSTVGIVKEPPVTFRDFKLTNQDGQAMRISDLKGKGVLVFFGYTRCPDVCPVTMADFLQVKKALGEEASKMAFVMISLDGSRDKPDTLKNYLKSFDPTFIGLTGDEEIVRDVILDFGGQFGRQRDGTSNYLVTHTAYSYFITPEGEWARAYPFQADPKTVALEIRPYLQ